MMRFIAICMSVLFIALPSAQAQKAIAVDLAQEKIDITTGFNGAYLTLYGVQKQPGIVAVSITSPQRDTMVRLKESVSGIWMNRQHIRYDGVPYYYDYAVSGEISEADLQGLGIGARAQIADEQPEEFTQGLIRNKQAKKLYPKAAEEIKFIEDGFFKTSFYIPSMVPTGIYEIKTYLIQNGQVREERVQEMHVEHVGMSAAISHFAHQYAFAYGLMCVAFAVSVGWFSNFVRRRLR